MPKKRSSCFSDLDFTIRYGKTLIKEKLSKKSNGEGKDEWILWIIMTKWVKFDKWMNFEDSPDLRKIIEEKLNP